MRVSNALLVLVLTASLSFVCSAHADSAMKPEATPYRPTVSTPAALSAPGWLEAEFGAIDVDDRHDASGTPRRDSLPYTFKYAFSEDWGVRLGGEALVHARPDDGREETGFGDTSIVAKRRFALNDDAAFGLEVGVLAPTARRALQLGSGKPDWSVNGIYSVDFAGWHADLNALETRMGAHDTGSSRWQALGAVALSHPIATRWTLAGEVSGTTQRGQSGTAQALGAVSYALRPSCVFDIGAAHGLNRASPVWQVFTGVTIVLEKLD